MNEFAYNPFQEIILFESTIVLTTAFVPFLRTSVSVDFGLSVTYIYVQFSIGLFCQWALSRQWTDLATISRKKKLAGFCVVQDFATVMSPKDEWFKAVANRSSISISEEDQS